MEAAKDNKICPLLSDCLLRMGDLLLDCGAEISRVEDTLRRVGQAYGAARTDIFAIPSLLILNLTMPDGEAFSESRRIRSNGSTDFYRMEKLNALSRRCCTEDVPLAELSEQLDTISAGKKPLWLIFSGSFLAAGAFAVFFGGNVWDGVAAGCFGLFIALLQVRIGKTQLNQVATNLILSLLTGLGVGFLCRLIPSLHSDMILIGDIMLLIPGLAMTNAVRNMLVGDTISGVVRLAESIIWAIALAGGFMVAMLLLQTAG